MLFLCLASFAQCEISEIYYIFLFSLLKHLTSFDDFILLRVNISKHNNLGKVSLY